VLFLAIDSAFDIHCADAGGNENSADAVKAKAKTSAKKAPAKDEMKDMKK